MYIDPFCGCTVTCNEELAHRKQVLLLVIRVWPSKLFYGLKVHVFQVFSCVISAATNQNSSVFFFDKILKLGTVTNLHETDMEAAEINNLTCVICMSKQSQYGSHSNHSSDLIMDV